MSAAAIIDPLFLHGGLDACRYWKLGLPDELAFPYRVPL